MIKLFGWKFVKHVGEQQCPCTEHAHPGGRRSMLKLVGGAGLMTTSVVNSPKAYQVLRRIMARPQEGAIYRRAIANGIDQRNCDGSLLSWMTQDMRNPGLYER